MLSLLDHSTSSLKLVDIKGRVQESLWLEGLKTDSWDMVMGFLGGTPKV